MKQAIVYAVPLTDGHGEYIPTSGQRFSYYYLHGQAETENGYDICNANVDAVVYALMNCVFLCDIQPHDGSKPVRRGICRSKYDCGQMRGLISYVDDLEAVAQLLEPDKDMPVMFDHFKKELQEKYPETWATIKATVSKN